eukprot:TRINITY_DN9759_c0_g1_i1.p1 TRINITY_DN9759_c0_g1~~TRINITY_DN9759_c0_g1_i1.p1  ORF type:complete len:143 (-),score=7.62 TRINITY_DN9759_c0_g1_i1:52-480(-)
MQSGALNVDSLRALAAGVRLGVEADLVAFVQGGDARALESGDVKEDILRAAFRGDKSETLGFVKELYGAGLAHGITFRRCPVGDRLKCSRDAIDFLSGVDTACSRGRRFGTSQGLRRKVWFSSRWSRQCATKRTAEIGRAHV